ncbi:MFS transporter [Azohydromonas australica]|uniref:MFS transporter n=1 Tax=Azohydromonas australica TaxID=364039 RepID=UPI000423ECF6|nr:MFS transporter [Azohydromonas australica]
MTPAAPHDRAGPDLARLIAGYVGLHAAMAGARMAAPLLALSLGHGKAAIGLLVALFALAQVFLALPVGRLADRRGLKLPVGWSVIAATVGAGLAAAWPVYPVLCASALLTGGAVGAATIALQRHVGRAASSTHQLRQAFAWLSTAPGLSNFLGPFAAGLVIDRAGYRAAFGLLALLPLLAWLLIRAVQELPNQHAAGAGKSGTSWNLWRDPIFSRLLLMNWCMAAAWDVHGFMVPVLGHERGLSASVIGGILGTFAVAVVAVRLALPLIAARLQEWVLMVGAMAATGVLLVLYPLAQSPLAMAVCSASIGIFLGAVQPMVMSLLHQITPPHRHGEAVAMRLMVINVSSVAMPLLFGAAGGLVGVSGVFWTMGLVVGLGSRLGLGLRHRVGGSIGH